MLEGAHCLRNYIRGEGGEGGERRIKREEVVVK
jgi:hypothetical protein